MQNYLRLLCLIPGLLFLLSSKAQITANDEVPEVNDFFRYGVNPSYYPNWGNLDTTLANIAAGNPEVGVAGAGCKAWRATLPEWFINQFGNNVRTFAFEHYEKLGMTNHTVFLEGPQPDHIDQTEYCAGTPSVIFKDLYLDIWDNGENGTPVNDNNHYALYCYNVATTYSQYVKFWEIWNEPDFSSSPLAYAEIGTPGNWWENDPDPCDMLIKAPIYNYIRMLRISYEVIKSVDPEAFITTGGIGYPSFLHAIMRNTDNPDNGEESNDYPLTGGAYFDAVSYHQYPHIDNCYRIGWNNEIQNFDFRRHSDGAADCLVERKGDYQSVLAEFGYDGSTYPQKEYIITESNLPRKGIFGGDENFGNDELQRNWIIKACIRAQQNDISQFHIYRLGEVEDYETATFEFALMGLYKNLNASAPYSQEYTDEGIAYRTMSEEIFGYHVDHQTTAAMDLPDGVEGAAFVNDAGEYKYVLWARTETDTSEDASAVYSFPSSFGLNILTAKSWSSSVDGTETSIANTEIMLTGSPLFLTLSGVIEPNEVEVVLEVQNLSCAGGDDGRLEAIATGGESPYSYLWSNGETTSFIDGLAAGNYSVEVTDANGTVTVSSAEVTEPIEEVYELYVVERLSCDNEAVWVYYTHTDNVDYTVGVFTEPGDYIEIVELENGCNIKVQFTIIQNVSITISDIPESFSFDWVSCSEDAVISAFLDGGNSSMGFEYYYEWSTDDGLILSGGGNSPIVEIGRAGTYTLNVINTTNFCSAESSTLVTVNFSPTDVDITGAVVTDALGNTSTGSIIPNVSGGVAPFTYEWSNGSTTQSIYDLLPGTYGLTVTDAEACEVVRAYTVEEDSIMPGDLVIQFLVSEISCAGSADGQIAVTNIIGGTAPYEYDWSTGDNGLELSDLGPGEYALTVTDANGATASRSVILIDPSQIVISFIAEDKITCFDDEVNVIYTHSNGETFDLGTYTNPGTYNVPIQIMGACDIIISLTIINDRVYPIANAGMAIDKFGTSCDEVEFLATLNGGLSSTGPEIDYWWRTFDGEIVGPDDEITCQVSQSGTYTLLVINTENGCVSDDEVLVEFNNTISDLEIGEADIQNAGSNNDAGSITPTISGGVPPYLYEWSNGATTSSINNLPAGTYTLIVTDALGCLREKVFEILEGSTSLDEVSKKSVVKFFPNPSSGLIQVHSSDLLQNLRLYNLSGQEIWRHESIEKEGLLIKLDLQFLESGCYLLKYKTDKNLGVEKIMIF